MEDYLEIGSAMIHQITLTDEYDNTASNDATCIGILMEMDSTDAIDTQNYTYIDGSDGVYKAIFPASITADLTADTEYRIKTTISYSGVTSRIIYEVARAREPYLY